MSRDDGTKELLGKLLGNLYAQAAEGQRATTHQNDSYLIAADGQYLGRITDNSFDTQSILNSFGPYGSPYSSTSIFNEYSQYGSEYSQLSLRNAYTQTPPKLFINGELKGAVSANELLPNHIPTKAFFYALKNNLSSLLAGHIVRDEIDARKMSKDSFIIAADETYLGSLNPNRYDNGSIFNKYGPHGSKYGSPSIFNKYSPYGGKFSHYSPFNSNTHTPPKIFHDGEFFAYLTVNSSIKPRVDPDNIFEWAQRNVKKSYR